MKIYVASSWKNKDQPEVVDYLEDIGHEVYDFRGNGFNFKYINSRWESQKISDIREQLLLHPLANEGFYKDRKALEWADCCVVVYPCGNSSHLEAGFTTGKGKNTCAFFCEDYFTRPDLMMKLLDNIVIGYPELDDWLAEQENK